jgi:hypothetical protein
MGKKESKFPPVRSDDSDYPSPLVCGFLIDNTGSLVLTIQKLQKVVAGGKYFCRGYWIMQNI